MVVSERQRGNPVLNHIFNVPWEYGDIIPDYVLGETTCALYLSIRYAMLNPKYLHMRIGLVRSLYRTRILLLHVDVDDNEKPIEEVTKIAFVNNWTLICAWSCEEVARYLETFKLYEKKPADMLRERVDEKDQKGQFTAALNVIRAVNKTDVATLATSFGSFARLANASMEELALCPGLGHKKVKRIFHAFHRPFVTSRYVGPTPGSTPVQRAGSGSGLGLSSGSQNSQARANLGSGPNVASGQGTGSRSSGPGSGSGSSADAGIGSSRAAATAGIDNDDDVLLVETRAASRFMGSAGRARGPQSVPGQGLAAKSRPQSGSEPELMDLTGSDIVDLPPVPLSAPGESGSSSPEIRPASGVDDNAMHDVIMPAPVADRNANVHGAVVAHMPAPGPVSVVVAAEPGRDSDPAGSVSVSTPFANPLASVELTQTLSKARPKLKRLADLRVRPKQS